MSFDTSFIPVKFRFCFNVEISVYREIREVWPQRASTTTTNKIDKHRGLSQRSLGGFDIGLELEQLWQSFIVIQRCFQLSS